MDDDVDSTKNMQVIHWPVLIKYHADDSLVLIRTQAQWTSEELSADHQLIELTVDSNGRLLTLSNTGPVIDPNNYAERQLSISRFASLIRAHVANEGHCCSAKMSVLNYAQGFNVIQMLYKN